MKATQLPPSTARCAGIAVLSLALLLSGVSSGAAQLSPVPSPGSRVRITAPRHDLKRAVGVVQDTSSSAPTVQFSRLPTTTIPRSDITALDISIGHRRRGMEGFGLGALIGGGFGIFLGLASGDDEAGFIQFSAEEKAALAGVVLGVTGAIVGLLAGLGSRTDVWQPTSRARLHPTVFPTVTGDAFGLRVGLAFRF